MEDHVTSMAQYFVDLCRKGFTLNLCNTRYNNGKLYVINTAQDTYIFSNEMLYDEKLLQIISNKNIEAIIISWDIEDNILDAINISSLISDPNINQCLIEFKNKYGQHIITDVENFHMFDDVTRPITIQISYDPKYFILGG